MKFMKPMMFWEIQIKEGYTIYVVRMGSRCRKKAMRIMENTLIISIKKGFKAAINLVSTF